MPEWAEIQGLSTRLAGVAKDVPFDDYPRKKTRSMGRVALLATYATEQALADAGLGPDLPSMPEVGLAYGSTHGSSSAQEEFCRTLFARNGLRGIPSTSYLKFMSNTCVVNLANFFGIQGPRDLDLLRLHQRAATRSATASRRSAPASWTS